MKNPASLQPGDIVIVRQQIIDGQEIKSRMWVVISKNLLHQNSNGCILLAITTNPITSSFMMRIEHRHIQTGSLDRIDESKVIVDKPVWTKIADITGVVGKITPAFYQDIKSKLKSDILEI